MSNTVQFWETIFQRKILTPTIMPKFKEGAIPHLKRNKTMKIISPLLFASFKFWGL